MTREVDFLLVGGGPACATAADTLRYEGARGSIVIIAAEPHLPYTRPALSKQFLLGTRPRDRLDMFGEDFYRKEQIGLLLATRATAVDPSEHLVQTDAAGDFHYGKLLIATGSRPNRLKIPGGDMPGIFYLRTLEDAEKIKNAAMDGNARAVIIGGNFIGMEMASTLRQKGLTVTLLVKTNALFDTLQANVLSEFFLNYYRDRGVEILFEDCPSEFQGEDRVHQVITNAGRTIPCDMVVIGIGASPEIEFLNGSEIEVSDGIVVDQYLQASRPDIFAAGDVAVFFDPVFQTRRRVQHWDNAVKQGRLAAKNMLGQRRSYGGVSYFFSDVFDITFEFFGSVKDINERVERGALAKRSFALFYLKDSVPKALFSIGRPADEIKAVESLIQHRVSLDPFRAGLPDPEFELDEIPAQTVFILQGGGALGAFECGVLKALEEARIYPDVVAGVSIGALNGAIVAGNPRNASAALEAFWNDLAVDTPEVGDETLRQLLTSWQVMVFGSPKFFRPRWLMPFSIPTDLASSWTSFYDPSPVKELLRKYVDFSRLKSSPVRLMVNAVNVETAQLETFDSYIDELTPEHILASGSLPPGFPWTRVGEKYYWDGGIVSNSPLEQLIEHCGASGKRVFIIDLYSIQKPLPKDLPGVMARRDEIVYSERVRKDLRAHELVHDFRRLVDEILNTLPGDSAGVIRQRPSYVQLMGDLAPLKITRIILDRKEGELPTRDYDFSTKSLERHKRAGYLAARKVLNETAGATR